jgi:hypothetical protein
MHYAQEARARVGGRLRQLAATGRWDLATALAGEDRTLRETVARLQAAAAAAAAAAHARADASDSGWSAWGAAALGTTGGGSEVRRGDFDSMHRVAPSSVAAITYQYLPLDLPRGAVLFVDNSEDLAAAAASLSRDAVIGLDSEWRPDGGGRSGGSSSVDVSPMSPYSPTALLQLAGERSVVLLDMIKLGSECPAALAAALNTVLVTPRPPTTTTGAGFEDEPSGSGRPELRNETERDRSGGGSPRCHEMETETEMEAVTSTEAKTSPMGGPPVVLGFGIAEDLRRLVRTHPGPVARVVASIPAALCLQAVAVGGVPVQAMAMAGGSAPRGGGSRVGAHRGGGHIASFGWGSQPGLSVVTNALLGLPLDKSETCGDWAARPLTEAQVRYAAQDARVLVRLLPGLLFEGTGLAVAGGAAAGVATGARDSAATVAAAMASPATTFIGDVVVVPTTVGGGGGISKAADISVGVSDSDGNLVSNSPSSASMSSSSPTTAGGCLAAPSSTIVVTPPALWIPTPPPPLSAAAVAAALRERLPP